MRILVIGGCGFIGSHVVDQIVSSGYEAIVIDRDQERFRPPVPQVVYHYADFGNLSLLEEVMKVCRIDVVVHLVSTTIPQSSNDNPIFDVQTNLVQSIALLDLCVKFKIRKVIFISSGGTVYGTPRVSPVPETHPTLPNCSYGITKLAIEQYLRLYHLLHGLNYTILRVSNPYGPRQNPHRKQGVAAVFMYKILSEEAITVWGDGSIIRDYIHVSDVARACLVSSQSPYVGTCNVGSGKGLSVKQLMAMIQTVTGKPANVNWLQGRTFDVAKIVLDCSKAEQELSWRPEVEIMVGLYGMKNWMIESLVKP